MGINTVKYLLSALLLLGSLTAFSYEHPRRHILPKSISSKRAAAAKRAKPYTGEKRQLVVLASFSDLDFESEDPLDLWNTILNQPNYHESPFHGSVHDYFYDQSYGKFDLQFDLHAIKVNKEHAIYHSTREDDENAALLLLALADSLKDIVTDWAPYDWDEDGYIDQILVLFAGLGQNDGGDSNTIWAHQASLTIYNHTPVTVNSHEKDYIIDNYGFIPEKGKTCATFGTLCHEFGHCMTLPDFYFGNSSIVGDWDIMDNGNYNNKGYCPPNYSAHERLVLGWLDVKELTEPVSITNMPALGDEPVAYMIRNDAYPNEYYILENRQQQGWDKHLPGSGLVIFHIDYDEKDSLTNNSYPAATLRHAAPDGTKLMSKPITNIRVNDGLVSFDFMGGNSSQTAIQQQTANLQSPIKEVYDLSGRQIPQGAMGTGIYLIKYANGQTRKVVRR